MLQNRNSFYCVVILIQSEIIESAERSWKYFKHIFNFYIWISWVTEWMPICLMRNTKDIFVSLRQINTRGGGGTPSLKVVSRLPGTHGLKSLWAPKKGGQNSMCCRRAKK